MITNPANIAQALRSIADSIEGIPSEEIGTRLLVTVIVQPSTLAEESARVRAVDAVCAAVLGVPAATEEMSSGVWHHRAARSVADFVEVRTYSGVTSPAERAHKAEVEALRAQLAELEAKVAVEA